MTEAAHFRQLREELGLSEAGYDASGHAICVVHDPLRHKYFRVPEQMVRTLANWGGGDASAIDKMSRPTRPAMETAASFLGDMRLLRLPTEGRAALLQERLLTETNLFSKLLHNYLFFRIPLVDPTPLLDALLPTARLLVRPFALVLHVVVAIVGLYFTARQWDHYVAGFTGALSLDGLVSFGTTLLILKVFHELGHGFVARAYGCRVPTAGVAFMLLAPMLYTEVSDAWRLRNARSRFAIAAAGIAVELAIAAWALLLWAFMADGPLRSILFFVSSTAWLTSILVNGSPFMRFDGYHMLGDALRVQNIGPRSFALANWKLREWLFGLDESPPERLSALLHRGLIFFAWSTCLYRFTLFMGIAYLVYTMFPKVLGLPLAFIEVYYFIYRPVWREVKSWFAGGMARLFRSRRSFVNLVLLSVACLLCMLPLDRHVSMPAVLLPALETTLYPPETAQVATVAVITGQHVKAGDVILTLTAPSITFQRQKTELSLAIVDLQLARIVADAKGRAQVQMLQKDRQRLHEELSGISARERRLQLFAPFAGVVSDVVAGLATGMWVSRQQALLRLSGDSGLSVVGLAAEAHAVRLEEGSIAVFIAEDGARAALQVKLVKVGLPGSEGAEQPYLASTYGGPVPFGKDEAGRLQPTLAVLPVKFSAMGDIPVQAVRGTITVKAQPESLLSQALARVAVVVLRESGF
jgi:putative peptide zinc metalloprotease protein